ncbi:MAG: SAM-dependent methyltransferase [Leptospiraceae bacterium]|nr:SAM-dependent methyltransferase [Leptospiraceae bacterium]
MNLNFDNNFEENTIYLIGGGSGNIRHLTLEAFSILSQADTIFYDMYMDQMKNDFPNAEWIFVGKKKGEHLIKQSEINELLLKNFKDNKKTVRLKGGDPAFFARSSEEIEYLKENGAQVKMIMGISSPQLLAETLICSLTHRTKTRSISFWSGYWDKEISPNATPNTDAHFIFMGLGQAKEILQKILDSGRDPKTVCIFATHLGHLESSIWKTTISEAMLSIEDKKLSSPTLLVVGLEHID